MEIITFLKMAIRNLIRHYRRSFITLGMIAVGMAGLMFHRAFAEGSYAQAITNFTNIATGHIQIYRQGFFKTLDVESAIENSRQLEGFIRNHSDVKGISPRVISQVLIGTATSSQGILLLGILPETESTVTSIADFVISGKFLERNDKGSIIIGKYLAEALKVSVGDKVVIFAQGYQGTMGASTFRIKGIVETGGRDTDCCMAFVTIQDARELLNYSNEVSALAIKLNSLKKVKDVSQSLKGRFLKDGYEVLRWDEIAPEMMQWVGFFDGIIQVILIVVLLVIAAGIMNTILMGVFERTKEFGLMMALGTKRYQVMTVVLFESVILALLGILLGVILGLGVVGYFHKFGIDLSGFAEVRKNFYLGQFIYPIPSMKHLLTSVILLFIDTVVFSIYPAWRAASVEPVEAMRYI